MLRKVSLYRHLFYSSNSVLSDVLEYILLIIIQTNYELCCLQVLFMNVCMIDFTCRPASL